ncbi:hypothetical protein QBC35DRAFT_510368 [Podospora australis]|uniref:Uncharacterized protein n=1 Tax=Podospora australis TaxID=1536484 RepID=A0AAN7ADP8_9PEZI|nr:hypothetical protein QBC35DRAFT_510368 [Podospora australis]
MERYAESWKAVTAYIWRTHYLQAVGETVGKARPAESTEDNDNAAAADYVETEQAEEAAPGGHGPIRNRRPAYHFTAPQAQGWKRLRDAAYACIIAESPGHSDEDEGTDEGVDEEQSSSDRSLQRSPGIRGLERPILAFFNTLLDHDIGDNEFHNALYSGLAVLGIHEGHGWRTALVYTSRLSAIVTVARMLVLYKAKQERDDEVEQRRAAGETQQEARRNARSHFDRVREMIQRFMTIVAFDGQPSPMDSILRLRAYGKAIRGNTNADGVVDWHGDELLYGHVQPTKNKNRK